MNNETINTARKSKLRNGLARSIAEDWRWNLRGNEFCRYEPIGLRNGVTFECWFYCNTTRVRAHIEGKETYGIESREETFTGEEAWADCIDWLTENITEMDSIIQLRDALARPAQTEYFRKLKGV